MCPYLHVLWDRVFRQLGNISENVLLPVLLKLWNISYLPKLVVYLLVHCTYRHNNIHFRNHIYHPSATKTQKPLALGSLSSKPMNSLCKCREITGLLLRTQKRQVTTLQLSASVWSFLEECGKYAEYQFEFCSPRIFAWIRFCIWKNRRRNIYIYIYLNQWFSNCRVSWPLLNLKIFRAFQHINISKYMLC
jgi:hypothetical protein